MMADCARRRRQRRLRGRSTSLLLLAALAAFALAAARSYASPVAAPLPATQRQSAEGDDAAPPPLVDSVDVFSDDAGEPAADDAGGPAADDAGGPAADDAGGPVADDLGEPAGDDVGEPAGDDVGEPAGDDVGELAADVAAGDDAAGDDAAGGGDGAAHADGESRAATAEGAEEDDIRFSILCRSCVNFETYKKMILKNEEFNGAALTSEVETVAEDGRATAKWERCSDDAADDSCFIVDRWTDESQFDVLYGVKTMQNELQTPEVEVLSGSSLRNVVVEIEDSQEDFSAFLNVRYECEPADDEVNVVRMNMAVDADNSVRLQWRKVCGRGENTQVQVNIRDDDGEAHGLASPWGSGDDAAMWEVSAHDPSSTLTMRLLSPALSQSFEPPQVSASDPSVVQLSVRGNGAAGGVLLPYDVQFDVNYMCVDDGIADIELEVPMMPFDPLRRRWRKVCTSHFPATGDAAPAAAPADAPAEDVVSRDVLKVGTRLDLDDVVSAAGGAAAGYEVSFESLRAEREEGAVQAGIAVVGEQDVAVTFYVGNDAASAVAQNIHKVSLTTQWPRLLYTRVDAGASVLKKQLQENGVELAPGESAALTVRFICKREGASAVLVTLTTLMHRSLEFGFVKRCRAPAKIKEKALFRTANSLMYLAVAALLCGGCASALLWQRRRRALADASQRRVGSNGAAATSGLRQPQIFK